MAKTTNGGMWSASGQKPRGRPIGWRKKDRLDHSLMIRMDETMWRWLAQEAKRAGISASDAVRQLIVAHQVGGQLVNRYVRAARLRAQRRRGTNGRSEP